MVKGYLGLAAGQRLYIFQRHIHVVGDSDHPFDRTRLPCGAFHKSRNDGHRTFHGDNSCLPHMAENSIKCQPFLLRLQSFAFSPYLNLSSPYTASFFKDSYIHYNFLQIPYTSFSLFSRKKGRFCLRPHKSSMYYCKIA